VNVRINVSVCLHVCVCVCVRVGLGVCIFVREFKGESERGFERVGARGHVQ